MDEYILFCDSGRLYGDHRDVGFGWAIACDGVVDFAFFRLVDNHNMLTKSHVFETIGALYGICDILNRSRTRPIITICIDNEGSIQHLNGTYRKTKKIPKFLRKALAEVHNCADIAAINVKNASQKSKRLHRICHSLARHAMRIPRLRDITNMQEYLNSANNLTRFVKDTWEKPYVRDLQLLCGYKKLLSDLRIVY